MTPYYQDELVTLYHGDCREVLPELALGRCGLVIADPPYGETSLQWDRWQRGWIEAVARQIRFYASLWCFGSLRMFMQNAQEFSHYFTFAQDLVWEKHNGSSFHADRFKRVHELCAHFYRGEWQHVWHKPVMISEATKRTVRRKQRPPHMGHIGAGSYRSEDGGPKFERSVIYERSCHGNADHPTQKPIRFLQRLLAYSLEPNTPVLDPMCGSGSVLVAAKSIGEHAIGIEADESYCEKSALRLSQGTLTEMFT